MLTTTFRGQLSTRSRGDHAHYYFSDHFLLNLFPHLGLGHDTYMQKPEIIMKRAVKSLRFEENTKKTQCRNRRAQPAGIC
jgi:hypothetical protein